jgi:hypothetical protein
MPAAAERLAQSPAALIPGLIDTRDEGITLAAVVTMNPTGPMRSPRLATAWAPELRQRFPDVTILSGDLLIFDATQRARAEGERLAPWCVLAILAPLWLYFRRLRSAWLAMLCLMVGFVWVLGAAQGFAGGLSLLSLVPLLFTLGVAVDYGIYATTDPAWRDPTISSNRLAPTCLCALTTILGSGALILTDHPALHWLGITLVAGLIGGYFASFFIVAPMTRWRWRRAALKPAILSRWRQLARLLRFLPPVALGALTLLIAIPLVAEIVLAHEAPAGIGPSRAHPPTRTVGSRTYTAGDSWMRWHSVGDNSGFWEFLQSGSDEDRGYAIAKLAGPVDVRIENEMFDQLDYFLPQVWSRWLVLRGMGTNMVDLPRYIAPEYQREIYWAAHFHDDPYQYMAPTYPRIIAYHALHDISQMLIDNPLIVPNTFACTGVISLPAYSAPENGHLFLGRNFDFEGGESFSRQKSVTYVIPPAGEGIPFAHVAWPGLSGAVTGMNAERLALFINAAATKDCRRIGTPTILMARDILQHSRNIEEAAAIIVRTQVFVSDIIVVADGKTGCARVFEKSPAATASYDVSQSAVVANHLMTPRFADDPVNRERESDGTTRQRYARARELLDRLSGRVTPEGLVGLLRDKQGLHDRPLGLGNRNAIDGLIACHGVVMDVTAGKMWVGAWPYVEGPFAEIDVLAMLSHSAGNPTFSAAIVPTLIAEDSMMASKVGQPSGWDQLRASRAAQQEAAAALVAGDLDVALSRSGEAIRENPDFYLGHEFRGRVLFRQGDKSGARAEFARALELDPPYASRRSAIEGMLQQCDTQGK